MPLSIICALLNWMRCWPSDRTITAAEAIYHLTHVRRGRAPVPALIVTEGGKPAGRPLRMIISSDMSALSAALGIGITGRSSGI